MDLSIIQTVSTVLGGAVKSGYEYVATKNNNEFKSLETSLKASAFVVDKISKTPDDKELIDSYRNTNALKASIKLVENSTEFSDEEKYKKLQEIHEKEILQQISGEKHSIIHNRETTKNIIVGTATFLGAALILKNNKRPKLKLHNRGIIGGIQKALPLRK